MYKIISSESLSQRAIKLQQHYGRIINIVKTISLEFNSSQLYSSLLDEGQKITNAEGGALYLLNNNVTQPLLEIVLMQNSDGIIGGTSINKERVFPPLLLTDPISGNPNENNISTLTANRGQTISIEDAYDTDNYNFSGAHQFDKENNLKTRSIISLPLYSVNQQVIGVLQFINFKNEQGEIIGFDEELLPLVEALASLATVAIEKQLMVDFQDDLLIKLANAPSPNHLYELILDKSQEITNADGGTLYLFKEDHKPRLEFAILRNNSLNIKRGGTSDSQIDYEPLALYDEKGCENHNNVATHVALTGEVINIPDVYIDKDFNFSGTRKFDDLTDYHSRSFLTIPMLNPKQEVIGVLQLINASAPESGEIIPFNPKLEPIIFALTSYASIILSNQLYLEEQKNLMDAFVKCIAKTIDEKSSHTSAHCQRVPRLMELFTNAACQEKKGTYKNFDLNKDEQYEIMISSWLHDCGKLATPDRVLDKATKLQTIRDGIEVVRTRFTSKLQQIELTYLKNTLLYPEKKTELKTNYLALTKKLKRDFSFIEKVNIGGEFLSDNERDKIKKIAQQTWINFNGDEQPLLTEEEVYNLNITKGTLISEERDIINNHMSVTIDMLSSLPFPKKLRNVPEYAGGHHERFDGSGFPNALTGDQMSIPAKMMSIADIFEALTSKERPYKKPMKISQSLSILKQMSKTGHIDPELFKLFLRSKIWETYANEHCLATQLDIDDYKPFL